MGAGLGLQRAWSRVWWVILTLAFVSLVGGTAGITITAQPSAVLVGDTVTLEIRDLPDASSFSLLIEGTMTPSQSLYQFRADNFQMPFALSDGTLHGYAENVVWTKVTVKQGDTRVSVKGNGTNGIFQLTETFNISAGTVEYLVIEGERLQPSTPVVYRLELHGNKEGPDDSRIFFTIGGADPGTVRLRAVVNGSSALNQEIRVQAPVSGGGGYGAWGGDGGDITTVPTTTIVPTVAPTTELPGGVITTVTTEDGRIILVAPTDEIQLRRIENLTSPRDWALSTSPCVITPEGITFTSPGELTFNLRGIATETPLFIAAYDGEEWRMLPSRIEGGNISADIAGGGVYGLMTFTTIDGEQAGGGRESDQSRGDTVTTSQPLAPPLGIAAVVAVLMARIWRSKTK